MRQLDRQSRDWLNVVAANAVRLVLGVITSVMVARSLGPDHFGVFAIIAGIVAIMTTFSDAGLSSAAVRFIARSGPREATKARRYGGIYAAAKLGLACFFFVFGVLFSTRISSWAFGDTGFAQLIALGLVGVLTTALSNVVSTILQGQGRFQDYTLMQIVQPLTTLLGLSIFLWINELRLSSVILLFIVTPAVTAAIGFFRGDFLPLRRWFSGRDNTVTGRTALTKLMGFGKWAFIATLSGALFSQLDLFLVRHWIGPQGAGQYALALSIAMKAAMVNGALITVLIPHVSQLNTQPNRRSFVTATWRKTLTASGFIFLAFPFLHVLIPLFYGAAYAPSSQLTQLLLIAVIIHLNTLPLSLLSYAIDKPRYLALGEAIKLIAFIGVAPYAVSRWGSVGLAGAKITAELVAAIFFLCLVLPGHRGRQPLLGTRHKSR